MELFELLENVHDEASFLKFVEALRVDRLQDMFDQAESPVDMFRRGPTGWENHTIEDFLEAALAWAKDSDFGSSQYIDVSNPWKKFAEFLHSGKIYE